MMNHKDIEKKSDEFAGVYSEPPVPIYGIARDNKVEVYTADFGKFSDRFSGFCDFENDNIYLNEKDTTERQCFTAAHEFGHWVLHRDDYIADPERYAFMSKRTETANGNPDDPMEREADCFATCLLMPRLLVKKFHPHYSPSDLADMFNVPLDLMEKRLKEVL